MDTDSARTSSRTISRTRASASAVWVQYGNEREANRDEQQDDGADENDVVSSSVGAVWDGERGKRGRAAGRWAGRERRGQQQQQQRGCSTRWGLSLPPPGLKGEGGPAEEGSR